MTDDELDVLMTEARSLAHDYNASSWLDDAADIGNQLAALTPKLAAALRAEIARRKRVEAALRDITAEATFGRTWNGLSDVIIRVNAALAEPTDADHQPGSD